MDTHGGLAIVLTFSPNSKAIPELIIDSPAEVSACMSAMASALREQGREDLAAVLDAIRIETFIIQERTQTP